MESYLWTPQARTKEGHDLVMKSRYLMVGAFTWLVPKGTRALEEKLDEVPEGA